MKWILVIWMISANGLSSTSVAVEFDDGNACETWRPRFIQRAQAQEPGAKVIALCGPKATPPQPPELEQATVGPLK